MLVELEGIKRMKTQTKCIFNNIQKQKFINKFITLLFLFLILPLQTVHADFLDYDICSSPAVVGSSVYFCANGEL